MSVLSRAVIGLIRGYQRYVSPGSAPKCRYLPTCSHYAVEAVERFGAMRGVYLATLRLVRCHPWAHGGVDMVPETFTARPHRGACA